MMASAVAIPFPDSMAHLLAEIECTETLVRLQIGRCRTAAKDQDPYRGLYISDAEIDSLLDQPFGASPYVAFTPTSEAGRLIGAMRAQCAARQAEAEHNGIRLRLAELAGKFGLDRLELDCLLICALPELDLRYERVYAYLQDDVTRKHATVDFALGLLCDSFPERLAARRHFGGHAPLFFWKLLERFEDPQGGRAPGPGHLLKPDERIIRWLLEGDEPDPQVASCSKLVVPASGCDLSGGEAWEKLSALVRPGADWPRIAYLYGSPGNAGQQIALALCRRYERPLLTIRLAEAARLDVAEFGVFLRRVVREAILHDAIPCCEDFDVFLTDEKRPWIEALAAELQLLKAPIFLLGERSWAPAGSMREMAVLCVEISRPDASRRQELWAAALGPQFSAPHEIAPIAEKFRFTEGQILDAVTTARGMAKWRNPEDSRISAMDIYAACQMQSSRRLSALARKIRPQFRWSDIILPVDRMEQLREICDVVKYRSLVFEQWGFDRKVSLGNGLNVLFAGPSGTGKTMAAEIIAGELSLDLYRIDLATIVSKYIGETEKNLSQIFREAEDSNAILFFDEADALFGKRSEVRDSHDRYANIEIGFLLQKMEEHAGIVILATNFRKNMDDAFVRRLHFTIDFPLPGERDRRRIWRTIWPEKISGPAELDINLLARRFELSGGNIRNAALCAAFLAASDGHKVTMAHVMRAILREYQKMGKVITEGEFAGVNENTDG